MIISTIATHASIDASYYAGTDIWNLPVHWKIEIDCSDDIFFFGQRVRVKINEGNKTVPIQYYAQVFNSALYGPNGRIALSVFLGWSDEASQFFSSSDHKAPYMVLKTTIPIPDDFMNH